MNKKKVKIDRQSIGKELMNLKVERTRVIGDMFFIPDTSNEYLAMQKRLDDLNERITEITNTLKRLEVGAK